MSRRALVALLLALAVAASAAPPLVAATGKGLRNRPSLLWKSYPLGQKAKARARAKARAAGRVMPTRQASAKTQVSASSSFPTLQLFTLLLAAMVAAATIVVSRLWPVHSGISFFRRRRRPQPPATTIRRRSGEELLEALQPWLPQGSGGTAEPAAVDEPAAEPAPPPPTPVAARTQPRRKPKPRRRPKKAQKQRKALKPERLPREQPAPTPEPEPEPAGEPVRRPAPPVEATRLAWCEIKLWRGFVKCQLYAVREGLEDEAIASSKYFRLRDDESPGPQGQQALAALLESLRAEGWMVALVGPTWYAHRLERYE